jgi:hypothetical protein
MYLIFERFKWGGVRHLDPLFIAFTLDQNSKTEKLVPPKGIMRFWMKSLWLLMIPHEGKIRDLEKHFLKLLNQIKKREKYYYKF